MQNNASNIPTRRSLDIFYFNDAPNRSSDDNALIRNVENVPTCSSDDAPPTCRYFNNVTIRSIDNSTTVYTFALRPEEYQPSGISDFSRIYDNRSSSIPEPNNSRSVCHRG